MHFGDNARLGILVAVELQVLPWQRVLRRTVAQIRNTEFFREVFCIPAAESDKRELDLASYRRCGSVSLL
jgi:hypothetical protein